MVKTIGKYELHRTLGEGSFGKVKYAINKETNEAVAIKVLDKDMLRKKNMSTQIKREISLMRLINHKNVIAIKDVFATATKIFMVLQLVEGGELFDKIVEQGKFSEPQARFYMRQIIDGMECCHNAGICHRDLKPENLLLDSDGNLKISDFGMARLYIGDPDAAGEVRAELLHTTCGTPNYVAPEVLTCQGYDGQKADVWSMGVILYVLLAGYLPFEESTTAALFKKIKTADFEYPAWFSSGVKSLLDRVLVVDPNERYSLQDMKNDPWIQEDDVAGPDSDSQASKIELIDDSASEPLAATPPVDLPADPPAPAVVSTVPAVSEHRKNPEVSEAKVDEGLKPAEAAQPLPPPPARTPAQAAAPPASSIEPPAAPGEQAKPSPAPEKAPVKPHVEDAAESKKDFTSKLPPAKPKEENAQSSPPPAEKPRPSVANSSSFSVSTRLPTIPEVSSNTDDLPSPVRKPEPAAPVPEMTPLPSAKQSSRAAASTSASTVTYSAQAAKVSAGISPKEEKVGSTGPSVVTVSEKTGSIDAPNVAVTKSASQSVPRQNSAVAAYVAEKLGANGSAKPSSNGQQTTPNKVASGNSNQSSGRPAKSSGEGITTPSKKPAISTSAAPQTSTAPPAKVSTSSSSSSSSASAGLMPIIEQLGCSTTSTTGSLIDCICNPFSALLKSSNSPQPLAEASRK